MKKLLAFLLAVVMCGSLCACGEDSSPTSIEDEIKSSVKSQIMANIALNYDTVGVPSVTSYVEEIGENEYEVTGKVTVKDKYGDSYTGKFDAEVEYNPDTEDCNVDLDLDTLYKD